jgi:arylsulfatase A-like enzyme
MGTLLCAGAPVRQGPRRTGAVRLTSGYAVIPAPRCPLAPSSPTPRPGSWRRAAGVGALGGLALVTVEAGFALAWPAPGAGLAALDLPVAIVLSVALGATSGLLARLLWRRGPGSLAWVPLAALLAPQLLRPLTDDYAWDSLLSGAIVLLAWLLPRVAGGLAGLVVVAVPVAVAVGLDRGEGSMVPHEGPASEHPDVLLITVDTLRADAGLELPQAESWRVYEQAVSGAPWTLPAMISLFAGQPVREHGGGLRPEHGRGYTTAREPHGWLPLAFAQGGYRCAAFTSNPYLGRGFGFDAGFHHFVHADAFREPFLARGAVERLVHLAGGPVQRLRRERDLRVVEEATAWMARPSKGPRFVWVHLLAPHEYQRDAADPPAGWEPYSEDAALLRGAYRGNVRVTEALVATLVAAVDPAGTVVAFTADHGEQLGEDGVFGHGLSLVDPELMVPLALRGPGVEPGRVEAQVASFDLGARLLALSGLGRPGAELVPRSEAPVGGLRRSGRADTFAWRLDAAPADARYRVDKPKPPRDPAPTVELDGETRRALEALGYLD